MCLVLYGIVDSFLVDPRSKVTDHIHIEPIFSFVHKYLSCLKSFINTTTQSASGLVVKSIVAIDGPRVRFAAGAI